MQIKDKDVKVNPVNHYSLNLYNGHDKMFATTPQGDAHIFLDRLMDQKSTEYTDIDYSCFLPLMTNGHASPHEPRKRMLWHCLLANLDSKTLGMLPTITDGPRIPRNCDCKSCIKCKLSREPNTPTTSCGTERVYLVHSDLCSSLETAIRGGLYMLLFIDDATSHTDEYMLKYKLEELEIFKVWKAFIVKDSGK
jgi:hypothetical protein